MIIINELKPLIKVLSPTINWKIPLLLALLLVFSACGLREARIKKQKSAAAHYQYGIAFLSDKPPEVLRAHIEFQKSIELDSKNLKAHYALGHVRFMLKKYQEAMTSFERALSINPAHSETHNYMGRIYVLRGEFDEAIASYEAALRNEKYETPEAPYWNLALVFIKQKKYRYAVQALNNAMVVKPNITSIHSLLGKVYALMGEHENAINAYQKAVQLAPDSINARYGLACAYQREGNLTRSEIEFNRILTRSPDLKERADFRTCLIPEN